MRLNEVIEQFIENGKDCTTPNHSLRVINGKLYSYYTLLAWWNSKAGKYEVNTTWYSVSTSKHQRYLYDMLAKKGCRCYEVSNKPKGYGWYK